MTINIIGIDLAKEIFHLHGLDKSEQSVMTKTLRRRQFAAYIHDLPPCIIAMEACAGAHHWGRVFRAYGHTVRLLAPHHVKPYAREQKNDRNDAKAIAVAALRPSMTYTDIKTQEQQAQAMLYKYRQRLIRTRTGQINAIRGHMAEFGIVVPKGRTHIGKLAELVTDELTELPPLAVRIGRTMFTRLETLDTEIDVLDREIKAQARSEVTTRRMMSVPGVGHMTALAIRALMADMACFKTGRGFAAAIGLVPRQKTTGGRPVLGGITKTGQRDVRRLLVVGAISVMAAAGRKDPEESPPWLRRMLASGKPFKVIAVALANKMARMIWAVTTKQEMYRQIEVG